MIHTSYDTNYPAYDPGDPATEAKVPPPTNTMLLTTYTHP